MGIRKNSDSPSPSFHYYLLFDFLSFLSKTPIYWSLYNCHLITSRTRTNPHHRNHKFITLASNSLYPSIVYHCTFTSYTCHRSDPLYCVVHRHFFFSSSEKVSISALMSVDIRQSLACLRYPSRFETVSRTQLSKEHSGDSIRPLDSH